MHPILNDKNQITMVVTNLSQNRNLKNKKGKNN